MSLCIDFKFNRLRDVHKVEWKNDSPWYCEVQDGLSWFGYCLNGDCQAFKRLFVVNRGYGIFKLQNEINDFTCPVCNQSSYELRNLGFVNCEWALKGALKQNTNSRVIVDGHTFDSKLYTFKELDYKRQIDYLNIFVKMNSENNIENLILSQREGKNLNDAGEPVPSLPSMSGGSEDSDPNHSEENQDSRNSKLISSQSIDS